VRFYSQWPQFLRRHTGEGRGPQVHAVYDVDRDEYLSLEVDTCRAEGTERDSAIRHKLRPIYRVWRSPLGRIKSEAYGSSAIQTGTPKSFHGVAARELGVAIY
jgi:hypothetical protein